MFFVFTMITSFVFGMGSIQKVFANYIDPTLSYQGRLTDAGGTPVSNGSRDFCFSIWTASTAGSKLWPSGTPTVMAATTTSGVFNVAIGSGADDLSTFDFAANSTLFLQVEARILAGGACLNLTNFEPLTPRQRISSTAFARSSFKVLGGTFTTALIVNGGTLTLTANAANNSVLTIGAGAVSVSGANTGDNSANSSTHFIGTTSIALNRASASQALTGITSIDGSAVSATNLAGGLGGSVPYQSAAGTTVMLANGSAGQVLQSNGTTLAPSWVTAAAGDMTLAGVQTITGAKTFLDTTFLLRNVANTFNGSFVNTNTANRIYTLKDAAGTIAFTSDITGTNSGTNTGDNAANSSSTFIGTTSVALNRASAALALTGITSIDGSAATLTTPRAINGVNFDGSAAITITAAGSTLSDTVTIAKGGTGQTTAVLGFNALSPVTTLGDTIFRDATNNVRLAGNITTAKQFLTQTGNGTVSAAPAWAGIVAGDVPTLNQNTTGTAATFTGNLTGIVTSTGMGTAIADGAIALAKLATTTAGHIVVGAVTTGIPTYVAMSGDIAIGNTGITAIGALKVTNAMLAGSIDLTAKVTGNLPVTNLNAGTGASATSFWRGDGTWVVPAGSGDMVLATAQTNTGIKTFLDTTMKLRNVANTFSGYFVNTNTADRIYTLPDVAGTLALVGGATTQVQYNNAGVLAGGAGMVYNSTNNILTIGGGTLTYATGADFGLVSVKAAGNTFYQGLTVQNTSAGTTASTDIIITNDIGTATTNYLDLGMNSSTYNEAAYNISGANAGYLYAQSGALSIGTASANELVFHTGGTTSAQRRMAISGSASTVTIGLEGTSTGILALTGATSGTANITVAAVAGTPTITLPSATGTLALAGATSGVDNTFNANGTQTITHGLGRTPVIIRIDGTGAFVANAAATPTPYSKGIWSSSGNASVYIRHNATLTTAQAGLSSTAFAIFSSTSAGNFITGVIQNVTSTTFDIVWTETGTSIVYPFLWEAQ